MNVLISTSLSTEESRAYAKEVSNYFKSLDGHIIDIFDHIDVTSDEDRYNRLHSGTDVIPIRQEFLYRMDTADILVIIPKDQFTTNKEIGFSIGESVSWEYTIALTKNIPVLFWDTHIGLGDLKNEN